MTRARKVLGLICAAALATGPAGCAYRWEKPGATEAQRLRDTAGCERYARGSYSWVRSRLRAAPERHRRGYDNRITTEYPLPSRSAEILSFFGDCMEEKGYRQVRQPSGKGPR